MGSRGDLRGCAFVVNNKRALANHSPEHQQPDQTQTHKSTQTRKWNTPLIGNMPCSGPLPCSQVPKSPPCAGSFPAVKAALRGLVPIVIDMVNKGRAVPGWTRHEICGPFIRATHSIAVLGWAWGMPGQIRLFLCAVALGFLSELDGSLQRLACVAWGIGRQALQARDPCVIKSRSSQRLHSVHS